MCDLRSRDDVAPEHLIAEPERLELDAHRSGVVDLVEHAQEPRPVGAPFTGKQEAKILPIDAGRSKPVLEMDDA